MSCTNEYIGCTDEKLGSCAISEANPGGIDPREGAAFTLAQAEINKLTNIHVDSGVDWQKVEEACSKILSEEGKDFNAAVWLLCAWTENRGITGLATGIQVLREMLQHFWEIMTPKVSRLRARRNLAEWMLDWLSAKMEQTFTPISSEQLAAMLSDWDAIDACWREKDPDGPGFFRLHRLLSQLPILDISTVDMQETEPSIEAVVQAPQAAGESESALTLVSPPSTELFVSPLASPMPASGPTLSLDDLGNARSVAAAVKDLFVCFEPLLDFRINAWVAMPLLFRLNRQRSWITLEQLPLSKAKVTGIPAPCASQQQLLMQLQTSGKPLDILRFCEKQLVFDPFWLDLNRLSYQALLCLDITATELPATGFTAKDAAASVAFETGQLLARLPTLAELHFVDGQPFADKATCSWLEDLALKPVVLKHIRQVTDLEDNIAKVGNDVGVCNDGRDAVQIAIDGAFCRVEQRGLSEVLSSLQEKLQRVSSGRDRFRLRRAQCELLHRFDPQVSLCVVLDVLLQEAKAQGLDQWEPDLLQPLLELAIVHDDDDIAHDDRSSKRLWTKQLAQINLLAFWRLTRAA